MLKLKHKKMDVWLKSKSLVKEIYKIVYSFYVSRFTVTLYGASYESKSN